MKNFKIYSGLGLLMLIMGLSVHAVPICSSSCDSELSAIKKLVKRIDKTVKQLAEKACCVDVVCIGQRNIPFVITKPGRYCLAEDVVIKKEGVAITIKTSDVELDLNNHTITLKDKEAGGIFVDTAANVSLKNGFIANIIDKEDERPLFGICISAGINISSTKIVVTGCVDNFFVANSCFIDVIDSTFQAGINGINIGHGPQNPDGIGGDEEGRSPQNVTRAPVIEELFNFNTFKIVNCRVILNRDFGIYINPPFEDGIIQNSIIDSNGKTGIFFDRNTELDTSCIIDTCLVTNNGENGIELANAETSFIISNCQIKNSGGIGCKIGGGETIELNQTQIYNSGVTGLFINNGSSDISINNCKIANAGEIPVQIYSSTSIIMNACSITSFFDSIAALFCGDVSNLLVKGCTISNTSNAQASNGCVLRLVSQAIFRECAFDSTSLGGGTTDGNTIKLAGGVDNFTLVNSTIGAVYPNGPDVSIGAYPDELAGVNSNIVIDNCVITNAFFDGIFFDSTFNGDIRNNVIATTVEGPGIALQGCTGIKIANNCVSDNIFQGIVLDENTHCCPVRDNTIYNNQGVGLLNAGGPSNQIYHNFAHGNIGGNYEGVDLVVAPAAGLGVLENISDDEGCVVVE